MMRCGLVANKDAQAIPRPVHSLGRIAGATNTTRTWKRSSLVSRRPPNVRERSIDYFRTVRTRWVDYKDKEYDPYVSLLGLWIATIAD